MGPAAIVLLVVVAWLVVAGMPFGRDEDRIEVTATGTATDTIAEAEPPASMPEQVPLSTSPDIAYGTTASQPGGVIVLPDTSVQSPAPQIPPPMTSAQPVPVPAPSRPPEPVPSTTPANPAPSPLPPRTEPVPPAPAGEITEAEAAELLRRFLISTGYYEGVSSACVKVRSSGYSNEGFGFSVWDGCAGGGGSRRLGVWRVDSRTGEVFVQKGSGRFGRP